MNIKLIIKMRVTSLKKSYVKGICHNSNSAQNSIYFIDLPTSTDKANGYNSNNCNVINSSLLSTNTMQDTLILEKPTIKRKRIADKKTIATKNSLSTELPLDRMMIHATENRNRSISILKKKSTELEDAIKALKAESEMTQQYQPEKILIKFPDPLINNDIVKGYSNSIETVCFPETYEPRTCEIVLKEGEDSKYVIQQLKKIPFGKDYLDAHIILPNLENKSATKPEEIDPYTLFLGNLPTRLNIKKIKEMFPNAKGYDMGYAAKMKFTKYVFICYQNVDDAIKAYKNNYNVVLGNRNILIRFRRCRNGIIMDKRYKNESNKSFPSSKTEFNYKEPQNSTPDLLFKNRIATDLQDKDNGKMMQTNSQDSDTDFSIVEPAEENIDEDLDLEEYFYEENENQKTTNQQKILSEDVNTIEDDNLTYYQESEQMGNMKAMRLEEHQMGSDNIKCWKEIAKTCKIRAVGSTNIVNENDRIIFQNQNVMNFKFTTEMNVKPTLLEADCKEEYNIENALKWHFIK